MLATKMEAVPESEFLRRERARRAEKVARLDALADSRDMYRAKHAYYYAEVERVTRFFVPPGARVLEIGCSTGDLLAAVAPSRGVGIDISPRTVAIAQKKYPQLEFRVGAAEELDLGGETFDYVIMSDVVGHLDDVWAAFRALRKVMHVNSRLVLTYYNMAWEAVIKAGAALGMKMPVPEQNWLGRQDLINLLGLNAFEVVQTGEAALIPVKLPVVSALANRLLARAPLLRHASLIQYFVCRPVWQYQAPPAHKKCSVVVPCRNEKGNVEDIFARVPDMGRGTELIFVDGNSSDGTVDEIEKRIAGRPSTKLIHQGDGTGKGDAVRKGFDAATGDIFFILDADLTVPPEDLPKFYTAIVEGRGEFVNGTRLVFPMEDEAMRFLNLVGNKFFSWAFTYILGGPIKDTLCGTKVLSRDNYEKIVRGRAYFGDFDPFGDFDLLFGAARAALAIVEVPVRYRARTYGETKISRFKHGLLLLRMTGIGFRKFKLAG
jgi:SAM-dependent methyltransferase